LQGVRELGLGALGWSREARALQARLSFIRRADPSSAGAWPAVDDAALLATLDEWLSPWLGGRSRREHFAKVDMGEVLAGLLDWDQRQRLDSMAPTHLAVPSGSRIPLDYSGESPAVAVRLQEVFGLTQTPRIAGGRVAVTMHLLSPAHRPVQVTQDLASFWARGYFEVKKDLKGRYPKHYWPDDPLLAEATHRRRR